MFSKIKEAFETYSQSSVLHLDPTLRSFDVKLGQAMLADKIIDILKSLKYKTIRYNEVFHEIFTSKAGFEVTIHLIQSRNGSTTIEASVFSPSNIPSPLTNVYYKSQRFLSNNSINSNM